MRMKLSRFSKAYSRAFYLSSPCTFHTRISNSLQILPSAQSAQVHSQKYSAKLQAFPINHNCICSKVGCRKFWQTALQIKTPASAPIQSTLLLSMLVCHSNGCAMQCTMCTQTSSMRMVRCGKSLELWSIEAKSFVEVQQFGIAIKMNNIKKTFLLSYFAYIYFHSVLSFLSSLLLMFVHFAFTRQIAALILWICMDHIYGRYSVNKSVCFYGSNRCWYRCHHKCCCLCDADIDIIIAVSTCYCYLLLLLYWYGMYSVEYKKCTQYREIQVHVITLPDSKIYVEHFFDVYNSEWCSLILLMLSKTFSIPFIDVVISFTFVKTIFHPKKSEDFNRNEHLYGKRDNKIKLHLFAGERWRDSAYTTINKYKYKYKAIAMNDLNANKYTEHLSAIVKSHKITWITCVKHTVFVRQNERLSNMDSSLFFTSFYHFHSIP